MIATISTTVNFSALLVPTSVTHQSRFRSALQIGQGLTATLASLGGAFGLLVQVFRLLDGRNVTMFGFGAGIVLTALAAVLAALPARREFWHGVAVGSSSMACVAFAVLAVFLVAGGWGSASIEITQPRSGDTVLVETVMRGDFARLADDERIWVAVVPLGLPEELFHPQNGPAETLPRGHWRATAFVGLAEPSDAGRSFRLVAFVADAEADEELRRYLARGRTTGDFPGLASLPPGTKTIDTVTVARRNA